jgi:hypothetical protein
MLLFSHGLVGSVRGGQTVQLPARSILGRRRCTPHEVFIVLRQKGRPLRYPVCRVAYRFIPGVGKAVVGDAVDNKTLVRIGVSAEFRRGPHRWGTLFGVGSWASLLPASRSRILGSVPLPLCTSAGCNVIYLLVHWLGWRRGVQGPNTAICLLQGRMKKTLARTNVTMTKQVNH